MYDLVLKNGTLVLPGGVVTGDLAVRDGKIASVGSVEGAALETVDVSGLVLLPGAVDPHVHMELPVGGARSCDDFLDGTRAAAAGGVTTILDFTVGSRETTMQEDLEERLAAASRSVIDYSFHSEVVGWTPERLEEMRAVASMGVGSFKFFTAYGDSGRRTENGPLYESLRVIAELGAVASVHAEDESMIQTLLAMMPEQDKASMTALAASRPSLCEASAVQVVAWLARQAGAKLHIMHLSSGMGLEEVQCARAEGVDITAETCPHYLLLTESVYSGQDARFYSASPALREDADREALWRGLSSGSVDFLSTDHCPFTRAQKAWKGAFDRLPYGLGGVELMLPLAYSEGVGGGWLSLQDLADRTSTAAARRYGLWPRKGSLLPGSDADVALLDPKATWCVSADSMISTCDFSPFEGLEVRGRVVSVLSRGEFLLRDGVLTAKPGRGVFLKRVPGSHGLMKNMKNMKNVKKRGGGMKDA
ncbi:MAG: dihydropyrimidinase [Fretibacterium sp.]|nr:dihydropyrimidinase [Fretibacterium sp.]